MPPQRHGARAAWAFLAVVVLAVAGLVGYRGLHAHGGVHYPKHWDARVLPYVHFVEKTRGLTFKHPIEVDFVPAKDFEKQVSSASGGKIGNALNGLAAQYRALGLITGDINLAKATSAFQGGAVIGLYNFATKKIEVRGDHLRVSDRSTLVHELTHALQDQYFDLARARAAQPADGSTGYLDVVEGDAVYTQDAYEATWTKAQQAQADREEAADSKAAVTALKGVPDVLVAAEEVPYTLGRAFVNYVVRAKGPAEENAIFNAMPTSDAQVLQPWRYLADGGAAEKDAHAVDPPVHAGEKVVGAGVLGAVQLYFMLSGQLGPQRALAAADGWDGDTYADVQHGSSTCVRLRVHTTASGRAALSSALSSWVGDTRPVLHGTFTASGRSLLVQTCDPGPGAHLAIHTSALRALQVAMNRVDIAASLLRKGDSPATAACAARRAIARFTPAQLYPTSVTPAIRAVVTRAVAACR